MNNKHGTVSEYISARAMPHLPAVKLPKRYGVFDVETQPSAKEVGGWHRADKMRISVAVLYDGAEDRYLSFEEDRINQLIERSRYNQLCYPFLSYIC